MAVLSDLGVDLSEGRRLAEEAVASGEALRALERLVEAQGGDPRVAERPWEVLETRAGHRRRRRRREPGSVARCGALAIGRAAMRLGAGRERKEDPIDHAVGIVVHAKPGDDVGRRRAARARARARRAAQAEHAVAEVLAAYELADAPGRAPAAPARDDRLMPELPEVETVRRRLLPHLSGRTLAEVEILDHRLTDPEPPEAVAARLQGVRIETLGRRGKYLIAELDDGAALLVHLRMTGNLLWLPQPPEADPRFLRARALLDDGSYLAYTDARRFGTWRVAEDGAEPGSRASSGPSRSATGRPPTWRARSRAAGRRSRPRSSTSASSRASATSMPTRRCSRRKIHPAAPAGRLSRARIARLHAAVVAALEAGIEAQGASISDFRTPDGGYGSAQERFVAYGRGGEPCVDLRHAPAAHRHRAARDDVLPALPALLAQLRRRRACRARRSRRARATAGSRRSAARRSRSAGRSSHPSDPRASAGSPADRRC